MKLEWPLQVLVAALLGLFLGGLFFVGLPLHYIVGFIFVIMLGAVFVLNLHLFMMVLFVMRPLLDHLLVSIRFPLGGMDLGLGGLLSLALVFGALFSLVTKPEIIAKSMMPIFFFYAFLCLVNVEAFFPCTDKGTGMKTLLRYFSTFSVMLLVMGSVTTEAQARAIIKSMLVSAVAASLAGLALYLKNGDRLLGTMGHPNIMAFYILIMVGCLFFQMDKPGVRKAMGIGRAMTFLLFGVVLLLTQTRSGWAAFLVMAFIYTMIFERRLIVPGALLVAALSFHPIVQEKIGNVFSSYGNQTVVSDNSSLGWRINKWKSLMKPAMRKPILGHGLNADFALGEDSLAAHNDYLRWFVQAGAVGVLAYFFPYFFLFLHTVKNYRRLNPNGLAKKLAGFFICFVPSFLLMSVSENLESYVIIHWFLWSLIAIYFYQVRIEMFNAGIAFEQKRKADGTPAFFPKGATA